MERTVISTNNAPAAIGPYSQAIKAAGQFVYLAGQIPLDPESGEIVGETIEEQTDQVLRNIQGILQAAEAKLGNVVKTTVFLNDMTDFAAMNQVYAQYFTDNPPARSAVGGLDLPKGVKVEIECVAII
jgi:2-iminobutanoate/2-iminopropanoate deaminase